MSGRGVRPVKILLPVDLADRVEEAIASELGGFRDRHSLVAAAIDAYLIDLLYSNASDQGVPTFDLPYGEANLADGAILPAVATVRPGIAVIDAVSALVDEPLLGLHNRDWPSLWALGVLADMTARGAIPWHTFLAEVTSRSWKVAERIGEMSTAADRKTTALLPTNKAKAQAAESAFQSFAIASVSRRPNSENKLTVSGPLPLWRVISFTITDGELHVGVSEAGWTLLERVHGLTPDTPHGREVAESFLDFLAMCSPSDWWGFKTMLASLAGSPSRQQYVTEFVAARQWKATVAGSSAQGYLARGREWGLVQAKMVDGHYLLTDFGKELLSHA